MTPVESFLDAAESFADLVAALPADLTGPGLGEWDLRALVGHASRSVITVSTYLGQPADSVAAESAAAYYVRIGELGLDPADVAERGRQAGLALGDDPATAVRHLVETVSDDLVAAADDPVITTIAGGMRLSDYLPTRTFELVVHGLDIAAATGLSWTPPADALAEAADLAARIAVLRGDGARLLRLVTGREPGGFSVVWQPGGRLGDGVSTISTTGGGAGPVAELDETHPRRSAAVVGRHDVDARSDARHA